MASFTQAEELGWSVGAGVISLNSDSSDTPFPTFGVNNKEYMLLPNINYQGKSWGVGTSGVRLFNTDSSGVNRTLLVGYPKSSISIESGSGVGKIGTSYDVGYADGVTTSLSIYAAGLEYGITQGHNARAGQQKQHWSLTAPMYIPKKQEGIVLGTLELNLKNNQYRIYEESGDYGELNQVNFKVFNVWEWSENLTTITSLTFDITGKASATNPSSTFFMLSYKLK